MIRLHILAGMLALCASACTPLDTFSLARTISPARDANPDWLHQAGRIKNMSPAELASEAESLQKAFAGRRNEDNRLRLALFLTLAPPPQGDRARALSLLDVAPSDSNGRGRTHPLAQLLLTLLQDNRRLDDALTTSQQKQRELQQANDAMRQKLEAISEIELKMQDRSKTR